MTIKIRYDGCKTPIELNEKGDWIDLYTAEDAELKAGDFKLISLGVEMELPKGTEANIVARSSTFMKYGIIQTNCFGVIDSNYCGDNDIWKMPVYATRDVFIPEGTRLCQFRINLTQAQQFGNRIEFEPVLTLGNKDRQGFGSTGH